MSLDGFAFVLHPYLAQGSKPPLGSVTRNQFDVLVLTAIEYQPKSVSFPQVRILHAPFDDIYTPVDAHTLKIATYAAHYVADYVRQKKRVLVTCQQGRNRSGLVTALALIELGVSPKKAIARIRQVRGGDALSNPYFVKVILAKSCSARYSYP